MLDIHFERPVLNQNKTPEENIAILDRWAAETVNLLNFMISKIEKENDDGK